jgi:predicted O-methyltransferase YrrM
MTPRQLAKAASFRLFEALDAVGIDLLPKHYYSPVPDYRWLRQHQPMWVGRASLAGVDWNLDAQLEWLRTVVAPSYPEVAGLKVFDAASHNGFGLGYGPIESQVLHGFLRSCRPRRIVEVGSGVSTACMVHALDLNEAEGKGRAQIFSVEPYPGRAFDDLRGVTLIRQMAQEVPLTLFEQLEAGDLLFIDSSHAVKVGSEVPRLYLDVIPRLRSGVVIHIHDIFLPYLYPRDIMRSFFAWEETTLALALLTGNQRISVLACLSALHYDRPAELQAILPDYRPQPGHEGLAEPGAPGHFPSSLWIRVK